MSAFVQRKSFNFMPFCPREGEEMTAFTCSCYNLSDIRNYCTLFYKLVFRVILS